MGFEFCRALDGGDHDTQCATDVRQSHYGKRRAKGFVCGYWLGAPGDNSVHNQPAEKNALEQVEDTVGGLCGRSRREREENMDFCGQENVWALVLLRTDSDRQCTGK